MKDLIKYIKAYKIKAILAPIFKMLEACFELIVPLVIARMVDEGISKSDKSVIISSGVILILLTTVGYIAALTAQYFAARAAMGFGNSLRSDLFRRIIHYVMST